jgi:hypothetical protein
MAAAPMVIMSGSALFSLKILQSISPLAQPKLKNEIFHTEWATIANQPFPLIHVLKLKKIEGNTNNQFE